MGPIASQTTSIALGIIIAAVVLFIGAAALTKYEIYRNTHTVSNFVGSMAREPHMQQCLVKDTKTGGWFNRCTYA